MPDLSSQFTLQASVVQNGQFSNGSTGWDTSAAPGVTFGSGLMICDGVGRNIVEQDLSDEIAEGETCLVRVESVSGGGRVLLGEIEINMGAGNPRCRLITAGSNRNLSFDFEEVAAEVTEVRVHPVTFAA